MRNLRICATSVLGVLTLAGCGSQHELVLKNMPASMQPTYAAGVDVKVDTQAYDGQPPHVGDVIVFHPPASVTNPLAPCGAQVTAGQLCPKATPGVARSLYFMDRIVAGPGQTISIQNGHVILDGKPTSEPFAAACSKPGCTYSQALKVPADAYFVLLDHRVASFDSRVYGPIPASAIVGKVTGRTTMPAHGRIGA